MTRGGPEYQTQLNRMHPTAMVFLDESGAIAQDRFFVVGVLRLDDASVLLRRVQRFRDREQWYSEFHFANMTAGSLLKFQRLADIVVATRGLRFQCFVADKDVANPVQRWGTHWAAYEKLAEQLLVGSIRPFEVVTVLADNYSTPPQVQFEVDVRARVNRRLKRCAVTTLTRIDSRASDGLQVVDLLTSVVGFKFRQAAGLAGAGNPKDQLAEYVHKAFNLPQAFTDVPLDVPAFCVRRYKG